MALRKESHLRKRRAWLQLARILGLLRPAHTGRTANYGRRLAHSQVVVRYRRTKYVIKADWDTWIHTTRLEANLRAMSAASSDPAYFGNTLWCSYSVADFQPCGYGFGPLQAASTRLVFLPLCHVSLSLAAAALSPGRVPLPAAGGRRAEG